MNDVPATTDVAMQVGAQVDNDVNGLPSVHVQIGWAFAQSVFVFPPEGAIELGKLMIQLGKAAQADREKNQLIVAPMSDSLSHFLKKGPHHD